ncbi:large ribosomal subunit protein mL37-like [Tubulanus polymorphus]|uniref:large ribosomal subunit protein mL37-like n=1 Tax=Tubulanus polymorphus TaxID=672921 RepID=UPI003DA4F82F
MRLTQTLYRTSMRYMIKRAWKFRGVPAMPNVVQHKFLREEGIEVENTMAEKEPLKWNPPVPDDPSIRWFFPKKKEDAKNWQENPLHVFNSGTKLTEALDQIRVLTKSQIIDGIPKNIESLMDAESMPDENLLVQRLIMQAHVWDTTYEQLPRRFNPRVPRWHFKSEKGIPFDKIPKLLLRNLVQLCSSLSHKYPEILMDRTLTRDHYTNSLLTMAGKPVMVNETLPFLLSSSKDLPIFADQETVDATVNVNLPDLDPLSPLLDVLKTHTYDPIESTGWKLASALNIPHTLFTTYTDYMTQEKWLSTDFWTSEQHVAQAVMFAFGRAVARAKAKYGANVTNLPEPVTVQGIKTDGEKFHFVCFQLNTLNINSNDGIKNLVWIDKDNYLFHKILPRRAMLRNTIYEDFDPSVFRKFLAFFLNGLHIEQ